MSFRTRVAASAAIVVAIAVVLACGAAYKTSRDALIGSADSSLVFAYSSIVTHAPAPSNRLIVEGQSAAGFGWIVSGPTGQALRSASAAFVQTDAVIRSVAAGTTPTTLRTVQGANGIELRELIKQLPAGTIVHTGVEHGIDEGYVARTPVALVIVEPFQGTVDRLKSLGLALLLVALIGVLIAALFGWLAARAALVPLAETTRDIEAVAATLDVSIRVTEGTNDELGRLRRAFNRLLEELEVSQDAQRQLILDASHELRTPLTSLRANAQVLRRFDELPADDQGQLSQDMVTQVDELTRLVGDLTELTRGEHSVEDALDLDLADLTGECVEIAETHARTRHVAIEFTSESCAVHAKRNRLTRAVGNLLDNAIKFSPEGGVVRIDCRDGVVVVEDAGPGIDEADAPFVFDRFYRSSKSRGMPGSGLGLAIVAQVVSEAGGTVEAGRSSTLGGARVTLALPVVSQRAGLST